MVRVDLIGADPVAALAVGTVYALEGGEGVAGDATDAVGIGLLGVQLGLPCGT